MASSFGKSLGLIKERFINPIFLIALAAAPIFPGCDGSTKMKSNLFFSEESDTFIVYNSFLTKNHGT